MKIALAQLNYKIGDFINNTEKIISSIKSAKADNCDLIVFSELAVCGYIPHDLLEQKDFIDTVYKSLDDISRSASDIAVLIGAPVLNESRSGKKLYNSAVFIDNGEIKKQIHKTLLPTYDIFDDYRYFEPNDKFELIEFKSSKIAVTICEDLWDKQEALYGFAKEELYKTSPLNELMKLKPDFVINIAGSPFSSDQERLRKHVLINNAVEHEIPLIYVNQTGANTELIYDGGSRVINSKGKIIKQLPHFEEALEYIDTSKLDTKKEIEKQEEDRIEKMYNALVCGVKDYFKKMGFKTAVMGLSGGIDSALTAAIVSDAIGSKNTYGILMPSQYSSEHSIKDAEQLAINLKMKYDIVPIEKSFNLLRDNLGDLFRGKPEDVTEENIQARLRGVILMAASNKHKHILINTSNKSEAAVGYTTLYGDMNGGLSVIGDVYKTDVFKMSRYINRDKELIPANTINKPPSAELRPGQKDEDSLPPYEILDSILFEYIEKKSSASDIIQAGFEAKTVKEILKMVNINEYKRFQSPPVLRVSSKSFGFGRRIPIVFSF